MALHESGVATQAHGAAAVTSVSRDSGARAAE